MTPASFVLASIESLITEPAANMSRLMQRARVPAMYHIDVSLEVLQSPMIDQRANGRIVHVWCKYVELMRKSLSLTTPLKWAFLNNVPAARLFARYVQAHPDACGLHRTVGGSLCVATELNATSKQTLLVAIARAGLAGISRAVVVQEYEGAWQDLVALTAEKCVYADTERVWELKKLPACFK